MKKIFLLVILISSLFISCGPPSGSTVSPGVVLPYTSKDIVGIGAFPYSEAKTLKVGDYLRFRSLGTVNMVLRLRNGYYITFYNGGSVYIDENDF